MRVHKEIEEAIEELVPGGRLVRAEPLKGGVSAEVSRVDIAAATGEARTVVFRQHRDVAFKGSRDDTIGLEFAVLSTLHDVGFAVPQPFLLHEADEGTGAWMLMEWIDGTTEVAAEELDVALEQMASFLAELHGLDVASLAIQGLEPIEDPVTAVGPYLPGDHHGEEVQFALNELEPLCEPNPPVLLHGDFWPGNVLWQAGTLAAVIDWEDTCLGDPLVDLAAARVELACAYGTDAMERFTGIYLAANQAATSAPVKLDALPVWEVYVSAAALSSMHEWGLAPAEEASRRACTRRFFERAAEELI